MHLTQRFQPNTKPLHLALKYLAAAQVKLHLPDYSHKIRWGTNHVQPGFLSKITKLGHHCSKYLKMEVLWAKNLIKIWRNLPSFIKIGLAMTVKIPSVVIIYNIILNVVYQIGLRTTMSFQNCYHIIAIILLVIYVCKSKLNRK